ncbi:MAG: hypothetical protein ACREX7_08160 [Casimicrobiaceae bacterium]
MKRRCRLAITIAALAMHLIAPVGAYAAVRPTAAFGDYCSAAVRVGLPSDAGARAQQRAASSGSGISAPLPHRHVHLHCASCFGAALAAAVLPSAPLVAVRPLALAAVTPDDACARFAFPSALLPPPRGPPSIDV